MRVIFLGTPDFSATCLERIVASRHQVVGVVTQPDRANSRRGNKIVFSPVKTFALAHDIPVFQFEHISAEGEDALRALQADIMVTAAYGQILRQNILDLCPKGIINVHASLLPKYRGSSPVQWAIINGDREIGVTIMQTELGVDTGAMIKKRAFTPTGEENVDEMMQKLSLVGAELVVEALDEIESGTAVYEKQDEAQATHCKMLRKEDGRLTFDKSALAVKNFVRGMTPWPSAYIDTPHGTIKVLRVREMEGAGVPGQILCADGKRGLIVACSTGAVEILRVKADNGKEMDAKAYLLGHSFTVGGVFGE
ncbi:MAG: methionyl-tRNA formyltransferase [Clostridia bacterium]|nr:methionyl-tRNA formyltransferase [Clostridia bacterium]